MCHCRSEGIRPRPVVASAARRLRILEERTGLRPDGYTSLRPDGYTSYNLWLGPAQHTEPLHFDKPKVRGTGPGLAFAKEIAKRNPEIRIGLVPTAVGGSGIQTWAPGGYHEKTGLYPWDDAVRRLQVAMQSGELKAVLWHQGESDSRPESADLYEARLHELIRRFRDAAGNDQLPFIVGQLGQFKQWSDGRQLVNAVHENVPAQFERTRFVSSDGLTDIGDGTHFDSESARELGRRYADAYADILLTTPP